MLPMSPGRLHMLTVIGVGITRTLTLCDYIFASAFRLFSLLLNVFQLFQFEMFVFVVNMHGWNMCKFA